MSTDAKSPTNVFSPDFMYQSDDFTGLILTMLKGGLKKEARDQMGELAANYVGYKARQAGVSIKKFPPDNSGQAALAGLHSPGYGFVPDVFSPHEIAEIIAHFGDKPVSYYINGYDGESGVAISSLDQLPPDSRFARFLPEDICRYPLFCKTVHRIDLLSIAAQYLRTAPTVATISLWWTFPSKHLEPGAQQFHHDRGDFRSCNLFVYLTDVSETSGPHAFVKDTHLFNSLIKMSTARFGADRQRFLAFWKFMENHRKSDEELRAYFDEEDFKIFLGPAGTSFFEDTRGLHRAVPPIDKPRLVFEIVYTVLPKYNEQRNEPIPRAEILNLGTSADHEIDPLLRYATRLHYS